MRLLRLASKPHIKYAHDGYLHLLAASNGLLCISNAREVWYVEKKVTYDAAVKSSVPCKEICLICQCAGITGFNTVEFCIFEANKGDNKSLLSCCKF